MSTQFFLYRRLARWITCEFALEGQSKIALKNKYEVASFKDVFCHPFYWQVFQWIEQPPELVIDCGAHCGHFSILADICFQSKFGKSATQYVFVEPNPYLLPIIQKNVSDAGIAHRVQIEHGLLGFKAGTGKLWVNHKNYLATGSTPSRGSKPVEVPYLDLLNFLGQRNIDLMKVDIEGGEFEFVESNLEIFKNVNLIFMELHEAPKEKHQKLINSLELVDLHLAAKPVEANGQQLIIFKRR